MLVKKEDGYPLLISVLTFLSIYFYRASEYAFMILTLLVVTYSYFAGKEYFEKYSEFWGWDEDEFPTRILNAFIITSFIILIFWFFNDE